MSNYARQRLEYFEYTFSEIFAFSGSEKVKRKRKLLQTSLGSIETCFIWIVTQITAFANFHFCSDLLLLKVDKILS